MKFVSRGRCNARKRRKAKPTNLFLVGTTLALTRERSDGKGVIFCLRDTNAAVRAINDIVDATGRNGANAGHATSLRHVHFSWDTMNADVLGKLIKSNEGDDVVVLANEEELRTNLRHGDVKMRMILFLF
jgi:hypothetical protein